MAVGKESENNGAGGELDTSRDHVETAAANLSGKETPRQIGHDQLWALQARKILDHGTAGRRQDRARKGPGSAAQRYPFQWRRGARERPQRPQLFT